MFLSHINVSLSLSLPSHFTEVCKDNKYLFGCSLYYKILVNLCNLFSVYLNESFIEITDLKFVLQNLFTACVFGGELLQNYFELINT